MRLMLFAAASLTLLAGCAHTVSYEKTGATEQQRDIDSKACWHYVFNTPEGRQKSDAVKVGRILGGGVAALVVTVVQEQAQDYDPKKDPSYLPVYRECMAGKGYAARVVPKA
jgi:hypothetical protein